MFLHNLSRVLLLACLALFFVPAGSPAKVSRDGQRTKVLEGTARNGSLTFRVSAATARNVVKAKVRHLGRDRRVSASRVRSAAGSGRLRLRARTSPRLVRTFRWSPKLVLTLRRTKRPLKPVPEPAPTPTPAGIANGSIVEPSCQVQWGGYGDGVQPPACWRPYAPTSPFNRKLPANPRLAPDSAAVVRRVTGFGPLQHMTGGAAGTTRDWGHPTFFSRPGDPVYTVECTEDWGTCPLEGKQIRMPDEARPAGGDDGHMTIVDQASGTEYDMWQVQSKTRGGGVVRTSWGGVTSIDGDGRGSGAVAANFGTAAGKLRAEELEAGRIEHALFMTVHCDSGKFVFPAQKAGGACADNGESAENAPPMGARFKLDMSAAEIAALNVPSWKKTILTAMSEYGLIVGDTGGTWGIKEESGLVYTAYGKPDKWREMAKKWDVPYYAPDDLHVFNIREGIDWQSRLKMVDPCVSAGTC